MSQSTQKIPQLNEPDAKSALWSAICIAAEKLSGQCAIYVSKCVSKDHQISSKKPMPNYERWQFVEVLSLLSILLKADSMISTQIMSIFGVTGPIHFIENGCDRYLWAQATLPGNKSQLGSRPDLIVTTSPERIDSTTILRIIECKCRVKLGSSAIRAEFGKAFDLKVSSYFIWSLKTPSDYIIDGAKRLGLDIESLGFDTEKGPRMVQNPELLVAHVANTLGYYKDSSNFSTIVSNNSKMIDAKRKQSNDLSTV